MAVGCDLRRGPGQLSALVVSRTREPGLYADGGGLYLQVTHADARSWIFRFMLNGRARSMGLGSLHTLTLAEARSKATECRKLCLDGIDPIEARQRVRSAAQLDAAKAMTFDACAEAYIEAHKKGWRNEKHVDQWRNTLATYASPVFGVLPVQAIDTGLVMRVIEPIWGDKTETATRVRGRIESVLDWAATRGYRQGENPARWRGHLQNLLPKRSKVQRVEHHAAIPFVQITEFVASLRQQNGTSPLALEFTILTAARTGEVIGATWDEIDLAERAWTVPAERMKGGREHRVPLCAQALRILERFRALDDKYVFPGGKRGRPLSNMAMLELLKRMGRPDLTVHGFRSTFRDWAAETTHFPNEMVEMALAHIIENKVEAAYRRGDLFQKRHELMNAWAVYCVG
ncbi:integrase arm-type DNA-binding domain-containing protein [Methylobacterium sp. J-001]|uniref:tyrosine-type recombinase/integrase n=1 Tax=Methylobacterium sp. J-001 TaxID=2836609 RepID=UPI001FBA8849|nr:site-specific integrase [Methylobacterium sp. J-001]MCJ2116761.1 integrase arm-type DNA-binding domain-containing protein [Methylobacterium sp. J-001]